MTWQRSPQQLEADVLAYIARIERAAEAGARRLAAILEADAKATAPWQDRTGLARRELFADVAVIGDLIVIYLSHGRDVDYGIYLEVRWGERFAVIWPTIRTHMDELLGLIAQELGS